MDAIVTVLGMIASFLLQFIEILINFFVSVLSLILQSIQSIFSGPH